MPTFAPQATKPSMLCRSAIGAATLAASLCITFAGAFAFDETKYPDWKGGWRRVAVPGVVGQPSYDPTKRGGNAQQAPLTPEYQAKLEASIADIAAGGHGLNEHTSCLPHGMPRMMNAVYPMEFVIQSKTTYILFEENLPRRVYTDGRKWPAELEPTFNGYSIGHWVDGAGDGRFNVLEIETRYMKGPRSYEGSGLPLHEDNETVIKERIFLDKDKPDLLHDEITVRDHALTRPWTVTKKYIRETRSAVWHFNDCSENNQHVFIGNDSFFVTADGFLMPVKKGQKPPDLRYFEPVKK